MRAESPTAKNIAGRCALVRYKDRREDFAVPGFYFPPKPTQKKTKWQGYWSICDSMLAWASERVDTLPNRCMQLVFGDINDDVGMQRK